MGVGEISMERQRMFTLRDALGGALGEYFDRSQGQMANCMVWDRRQGFGQFRFGRRKGRDRIGHKGNVRPRPGPCAPIQ